MFLSNSSTQNLPCDTTPQEETCHISRSQKDHLEDDIRLSFHEEMVIKSRNRNHHTCFVLNLKIKTNCCTLLYITATRTILNTSINTFNHRYDHHFYGFCTFLTTCDLNTFQNISTLTYINYRNRCQLQKSWLQKVYLIR